MPLRSNVLIDHEANIIVDAIKKSGGEARFVGGCVRDFLLKKDIHDIDLATSLFPDQVMEVLKSRDIKTIPTGIKHGTVTAVLNTKAFEITTLRYDIECDGRHADVQFTTDWQADASRRDFTFNALYMDEVGYIYDYFGGIKDLEARRLNFIGNAEERIKEDYLRILRAFRFHTQICMGSLDNEILEVCSKYSHMLTMLSGERIRDEMFKLLECDDPSSTLESMQRFYILKKVIPIAVNCKILSSELLVNTNAVVKLALLFRTTKNFIDVKDLAAAEEISKFWRFSRKQKKKLLFLLSHNIDLDLSEKEQKKYISLFGTELYCDLVKICGIESQQNIETIQQYISFANRFNIPKFPLSGNDLIGIGYRPGRDLGRDLKLIKKYWEESEYTLTKDDLLLYASTPLYRKNV